MLRHGRHRRGEPRGGRRAPGRPPALRRRRLAARRLDVAERPAAAPARSRSTTWPARSCCWAACTASRPRSTSCVQHVVAEAGPRRAGGPAASTPPTCSPGCPDRPPRAGSSGAPDQRRRLSPVACHRRATPHGGPMNDHDPILAKVRKLLALAEDPAATTARGGDLHRQGDPADRRLRHRPGPARRGRPRPRPGRRPDRRPRRAVRRRQGRPARHRCHPAALRGRAADPSRARGAAAPRSCRSISSAMPATSSAASCCSPACCCSRRTGLARTPVPAWEHKAAFRRSWLAGFRMAVGRRLAEAERRAEAQAATRYARAGTSTGLVLADRSALVVGAMESTYPHLGHRAPAPRSRARAAARAGPPASAPTSAARRSTGDAGSGRAADAAGAATRPGTTKARHPHG